MQTVAIRELNHHMAKYIKKVKAGERLIVLERNVPVAQIVPHNPHVVLPGWKRKIAPIRIKGEDLSLSIIKARHEER